MTYSRGPAGNGGMCQTFAGMNNEQNKKSYGDLAGGFLWDFDGIESNTTRCNGNVPTLNDYVNAITNGLANKCS